MARAKAWEEVTDEFWGRVEPLIPVRQRVADQTYSRKAGGGRKPKDPRLVFEGIAWRWQSIDGAMMKAPLAQQNLGPNPTDWGGEWARKRHLLVDGRGVPLPLVVTGANRHAVSQLEAVLEAIMVQTCPSAPQASQAFVCRCGLYRRTCAESHCGA